MFAECRPSVPPAASRGGLSFCHSVILSWAARGRISTPFAPFFGPLGVMTKPVRPVIALWCLNRHNLRYFRVTGGLTEPGPSVIACHWRFGANFRLFFSAEHNDRMTE